MKIITILFIFFILLVILANAQTCQWATKIGGTGEDHSFSIAKDVNGNVFVLGTFNSDTLFFNNGITLTNSGDYDGYIAKYNDSGTCQWASEIAGTGIDRPLSLTVDSNGNAYVAGYYNSSTLFFNNGISLTSYSYFEGFLAKFNSNGTCQWASNITGVNDDIVYSINVDASGNLYISGYYDYPYINFNNNISLINSGNKDGYIAKYNNNGICQWASKIAGTRDDIAYSIAVSTNGFVYVTGYFSSDTLNFNNGISLINTNNSAYNGFLAKYSSSGTCQWASKIAGDSSNFVYSITADSSGNVYIAGQSNSYNINFNNGISLSNSGYGDGYIAKYNNYGTCQWASKIAGTNNDVVYNIFVDTKGNLLIAGWFLSSTLVFSDRISLFNNTGLNASFISKYDTNGICQWASKISGNGNNRSLSITNDVNGYVYVAGDFSSSTFNFNNGISLNNSDGSNDGYITKYNGSNFIPSLVSPINNLTITTIIQTLIWHSSYAASSYKLQLATSSSFNSLLQNQVITDSSFNLSNLSYNTQYY